MLTAVLDTHLNTFHLELSFSAEVGKTTVLLGESGAGKSTVLKLLAGLLHPQRGHISLDDTIYFDSERRISIPPQERPFGYVFQDYVLFPHLSVFENAAFGLRAQHLTRQTVRQRVGEALEQVRLTGLDERRPTQLSGGQQQRVAIARALALQPLLLLLDEPLAALDVQTRREVRQELRNILSRVGITTVMVTHQYLEALLFGHHILVLDAGHVIQQGSQRDLLQYPRSSYVAELVGMNFFRGRIVRYEANTLCTIQLNGNSVQGMEIRAALEDQERGHPQGAPPSIHSTPAPTGYEEAYGNSVQDVEIRAALEDQERGHPQGAPPSIHSTPAPTDYEEAYVVVDPRSITLYSTAPESSARNVFHGEIVQLLRLGNQSSGGDGSDGRVRVSIMVDASMPPLIAEITEASATRMELSEGKTIYATFKATEARAYL